MLTIETAGRKRKQGSRYPSGKLRDSRIKRRLENQDDRMRSLRQPHRKALPESQRADPKAESVLGRLNLSGAITSDQYDAGTRYATIVGAYRAVIGGPRETAGSGKGFACLSSDSAVNGCGFDFGECECRRRSLAYNLAHDVLVANAGVRGARAVAEALRNVDAPDRLPELSCGLHALAKYFGLTNRPKSRSA